LQTNETELESRQILIRSEEADATAAAVSPGQRSRSNPASILGVVRGKSAASGCGRRNFPIRKPLKTLEMAKESRRCRFSLRPEQAFRRTPRLDPAASTNADANSQ
jgi:hypothetical protein